MGLVFEENLDRIIEERGRNIGINHLILLNAVDD